MKNALTSKSNLSLKVTPTENKDLNDFWKRYLMDTLSYEKVIIANFINQSLPYSKILEEYQNYNIDKRKI